MTSIRSVFLIRESVTIDASERLCDLIYIVWNAAPASEVTELRKLYDLMDGEMRDAHGREMESIVIDPDVLEPAIGQLKMELEAETSSISRDGRRELEEFISRAEDAIDRAHMSR